MRPSSSGCCQALSANVFYPNSTQYNSTQQSYWTLQESSIHPTCIVQPTTALQVGDAVSSLVSRNCSFAIKGHGHAPSAGFANVDDGVTIDLTSMRSVELWGDGTVARVGAGASWLDVYAVLDQSNKTVAGGRNGAVGVGGLTVGGGISYFSPQVGFTCDTLVNVEVVLGNGQVVNANATDNADLFRALKGGLNNFGIVARYDFSTIEYDGILGGSVGNDISQRDAVFDAFTNIAAAPDYDVHASVVLGLVYAAGKWSLSSTPIYTEPVLRPPVYAELFSVPNISDSMAIQRLGTFANETGLPPLNGLFLTSTFGATPGLLSSMFDILNQTLSSSSTVPSSTIWSSAFEPLPTVCVEHGSGRNALGTSSADGNSIILLLSAFWPDTADSDAVQAVANSVFAALNKEAENQGQAKRFVYANYAGPSQSPFLGYGEANIHFLRETAGRYDPQGVFRYNVPGGFKL
ncbi:hypothetical protein KVR01_012726 [Diaporthe batatas]|uniref:uncharacterized protein n=1 Tax=Diaporthe batatas TaxID=748121 RepID=UPI001D04594F|nr:uncharacterized protein KVR01_012726 [Diaporthe batatas]KAG8157342.1 hypothetical protein KVR01_012726 [Diaporthe batatas]